MITQKRCRKGSVIICQEKRIVICEHCDKKYRQIVSRQLVGHRTKEEDICSYCHKVNDESMEWDFTNSKL